MDQVFARGAGLNFVKGLSVKNYKLVWREPSGKASTSALNYSLGAAEDAQTRLQAEGAVVRIVEVPVGGDVPEAVVEEIRAEGAPAAA
ncbi:hypothetical protein [Streptomyces sp. NPDC050485]|uniref:hypothetical protein n=1 Tax=Streptomyces sp. NPDC050485 TaxID=3365617 RepID=UPI0037B384DF